MYLGRSSQKSNNMQSTLDESIIERENVAIIYGGFWPRLGALLLDGIILAPITFGLTFYNLFSLKSGALMMAVALIGIAYKPFMEYAYGATLGKMALRLKVVNQQLERPDLQTVLLRNIFHILPTLLTAVMSLGMYSNPDFEDVTGFMEYITFAQAYGSSQTISSLSSLIILIEAIMLAVDDRKRTLHDRIAGTFVIEKP
jgi:uncharacterized RDD family membrane protein YckC